LCRSRSHLTGSVDLKLFCDPFHWPKNRIEQQCFLFSVLHRTSPEGESWCWANNLYQRLPVCQGKQLQIALSHALSTLARVNSQVIHGGTYPGNRQSKNRSRGHVRAFEQISRTFQLAFGGKRLSMLGDSKRVRCWNRDSCQGRTVSYNLK